MNNCLPSVVRRNFFCVFGLDLCALHRTYIKHVRTNIDLQLQFQMSSTNVEEGERQRETAIRNGIKMKFNANDSNKAFKMQKERKKTRQIRMANVCVHVYFMLATTSIFSFTSIQFALSMYLRYEKNVAN